MARLLGLGVILKFIMGRLTVPDIEGPMLENARLFVRWPSPTAPPSWHSTWTTSGIFTTQSTIAPPPAEPPMPELEHPTRTGRMRPRDHFSVSALLARHKPSLGALLIVIIPAQMRLIAPKRPWKPWNHARPRRDPRP